MCRELLCVSRSIVPVKFTLMADILCVRRKVHKSKNSSSEAMCFSAHVSFSETLSFFWLWKYQHFTCFECKWIT